MPRNAWSQTFGNVTVRVAELGAYRATQRPHLPVRTWRRAMRLIDALGVEPALYRSDERAMAALERGDIDAAIRWRNLMVAIHAVSEERPPGVMGQ